jgi:hypothetical protein
MTNVTLIKLGVVLAAVLLVVRIMHLFRARAMRGFALSSNFRYIGPPAPPRWWLNPSRFEGPPRLPGWIEHFRPSGWRIRQVWNVIEGQRNGLAVLIFDCVIGEFKGGQPCTVIACQTEQNPFGTVISSDRLIQSHGWTVVHGSWFLWFSWMMSVRRIDEHMRKLRASQQA